MRSDRARARLVRISPVMAAANGDNPARDLSRACVTVLRVSGGSVVVMSHGLPTPLSSSDSTATRLEDLQHTLGEGPCIDAYTSGRGVFEPDLAMPRAARWPAFGPAALAAGARALFALPLRVGGVRLGALTLYRAHAGALSDDQHADAVAMANLIANAILAMQAEAEPGTLSPDLEVLISHRADLHQAAGMVSVQLGVGVGEALVRLRAHAYAADRPLAGVATDVLAHRLSFHD